MNETTKRIKKVVEGFSPLLGRDGFRRQSLNFSRTAGEALQVINLQLNRHITDESGSFTMNIGVHFDSVAKLLPGIIPMPTNPKETHCLVRTRVGMLMPKAEDHWWQVTSRTDLDALVKELGVAYSKYVIPWLASLATTESLASKKPGKHEIRHKWASAAALISLGDRPKATELVNAELKQLKNDSRFSDQGNEKLRELRLQQLRTWAQEQGLAIAAQ